MIKFITLLIIGGLIVSCVEDSTDNKVVPEPKDTEKVGTSSETFTDENGRLWKFKVTTAEPTTGPVLFVPHDDENTAYKVALNYINKNGGKVVAIDCNEKRRCGAIDPNRYFNSSKIFRDRVFAHYEGRNLMISLHNNNEGYGGAKGAISACIGFPWEGARSYRYDSSPDECDNLVVFNGPGATPSGLQGQFKNFLQAERINGIYEEFTSNNDGSASFAATQRNIFYINVESLATDEERQYHMLDRVHKWFNNRMINSVKKKETSSKSAIKKGL